MMPIVFNHSGWSNVIHGTRIPILCTSINTKRKVEYMQVSSDGLKSNVGRNFKVAVS